MAEVGSLTARAKMAIKIFVWRAFAIPVTDASFWCIIAKGWLAIAKLKPFHFTFPYFNIIKCFLKH